MFKPLLTAFVASLALTACGTATSLLDEIRVVEEKQKISRSVTLNLTVSFSGELEVSYARYTAPRPGIKGWAGFTDTHDSTVVFIRDIESDIIPIPEGATNLTVNTPIMFGESQNIYIERVEDEKGKLTDNIKLTAGVIILGIYQRGLDNQEKKQHWVDYFKLTKEDQSHTAASEAKNRIKSHTSGAKFENVESYRKQLDGTHSAMNRVPVTITYDLPTETKVISAEDTTENK